MNRAFIFPWTPWQLQIPPVVQVGPKTIRAIRKLIYRKLFKGVPVQVGLQTSRLIIYPWGNTPLIYSDFIMIIDSIDTLIITMKNHLNRDYELQLPIQVFCRQYFLHTSTKKHVNINQMERLAENTYIQQTEQHNAWPGSLASNCP